MLTLPSTDHTLISVPAEDHIFSKIAATQVAAVRDGAVGLRSARRTLRSTYPQADLHRQEHVAINGSSTDVWFAFRDGRRGSAAPLEPWWEERGVAQAIVHDSGRLTGVSDACATLMRLADADRVTATAGDFLPPSIVAEITDPEGSLRENGELTSTAILSRPNGEPIGIEYRAICDGAGPGRHSLAIRSLAERDNARMHWALEQSGLSAFEKGSLDELLRTARRHDLLPAERLPESLIADRWDVLVVSGLVRLHLILDTVEPTLIYGSAGAIVGTHWAHAEMEFALGLQSVTSSRLLLFDVRRFQQLASSDEVLARVLSDQGREMLHEVVRLYAVRASGSLSQRLARELLLLADLHRDPLLVPVTEQQLADGIGSIRESVARALAELRRRAWVATTRHGLLILDEPSLRSFAARGDT